MLKCYLFLTLCLQFALINAARTRRGSLTNGGVIKTGNGQEHVHIKVHIRDGGFRPSRPLAQNNFNSNHHKPANVLPQHQRANNKKVLPPTKATSSHHSETSSSSSKEMPYEFDFFGLGSSETEDNSLLTTTGDIMHNSKYGPVIFTSNIQGGAAQQPMSTQFMRQLFTPEMMTVLKTETDENSLGNHHYGLPVATSEEPVVTAADDMMQEYFEKFNEPKALQQTLNSNENWSPKLTHTRKKYGSTGIGEAYPKETLQQQFYNTILKQNQRKPTTRTTTSRARKSTQQQRQRKHPQRQHHHQQRPSQPKLQFQQYSQPPLYQNFKAFEQAFEDDTSTSSGYSAEFGSEAEEEDDVDASTSTSMEEDMTAAFDKLKPISYHDMYGEYATPITTASSSSSSSGTTSVSTLNQQQQQHQVPGFYTEAIPTYTSSYAIPHTANDWLQQYERPEKHQHQKQQQQETQHYKPHHQQQQLSTKKHHKPKSQQQTPHFVLHQPTTLQLGSSSPSSLSLSSSLSTSPISSGFGSDSSHHSTLNWSMPYDFVQQSHQHQLAAQQHPEYKPTSPKKRKNRLKRKRNRIIVE